MYVCPPLHFPLSTISVLVQPPYEEHILRIVISKWWWNVRHVNKNTDSGLLPFIVVIVVQGCGYHYHTQQHGQRWPYFCIYSYYQPNHQPKWEHINEDKLNITYLQNCNYNSTFIKVGHVIGGFYLDKEDNHKTKWARHKMTPLVSNGHLKMTQTSTDEGIYKSKFQQKTGSREKTWTEDYPVKVKDDLTKWQPQ